MIKIQQNKTYLLFFISSITLFLHIICFANEIEKKPDHMTITSNSALIKYKEKTYTFTGNVKIKTNDTIVTGNKVIAHQNEQHKFTSMLDYGTPAKYHSTQEPNKPPLDAEAKIIKFFPQSHHAILINEAFAKQGVNSIAAPILHYNTQQKVLKTKKTKQGRTHIMIDNQGNVYSAK